MTVIDDTIKGLTLGDPDGPLRFVDSLGREVPTYIDPRDDLKAKGEKPGTFKRLNYHVPFQLRGDFKPSQWPKAYAASVPDPRTDIEGFVLCTARSAHGGLCSNKAVNRTHFCRNHGGALHRADKKMSNKTIAPMGKERVENMDRVQKFMQGFLELNELEDDEVQGGFIRNNAGVPVRARILGMKFEQQIAKELHARLNRYLQSQTSDMLHVMVDIAKNDLYEAGDRIKAAIWVSERTMGKTPDVVLTGTTQAPYASILEGIESGSREDYRKSVNSHRVGPEVLDVDEVDEDGDFGPDGSSDNHGGLSLGEGTTLSDRWAADDERVRLQDNDDQDSEDSGVVESNQERAERIESERTSRLERAKKIRKAKQRRFAARAVGATSLSQQPWLVECLPIKGKTGYKLRLISPDQQTPALVERIMRERSWEEPTKEEIEARRAEVADAEIADLEAKLEQLQRKG
jgi:hypothetical protein